MIHERLDIDFWVKRYPLAQMEKEFQNCLSGPLPIAYIEQIRAEVQKAGGKLGPPVALDLCIWKYGDSERRDVTKIGGVPYWPAREGWPKVSWRKPYTFVAQFCFADSKDILPNLPGDILSILAAGNDYQRLEIRWFQLGEAKLLPPAKIPKSAWHIPPCHAVLHRTADYPEAEWKVFDKYPYPLNIWAKRLKDASRLGGAWELRGEIPKPDDLDDPEQRQEYQAELDHVAQQKRNFFCQLASMEATNRQPLVNVENRKALPEGERLLTIADAGGYDFFFDGESTSWEMHSG